MNQRMVCEAVELCVPFLCLIFLWAQLYVCDRLGPRERKNREKGNCGCMRAATHTDWPVVFLLI